MKTTKFILALSLALIFAAGADTVLALQKSSSMNPAAISSRAIIYRVKVACTNFYPLHLSQYEVVITDETGKQIGESQTYHPGITDYVFTEPGDVRGIRIARMVQIPLGPKSINIRPCVKSGLFLGGATYVFVIIPLPWETDARVDIR
jgi:hypothetical protein